MFPRFDTNFEIEFHDKSEFWTFHSVYLQIIITSVLLEDLGPRSEFTHVALESRHSYNVYVNYLILP